MKNFIAIGMSLLFLTCGLNKIDKTSSNLPKTIITETCPEDGKCTFEVFDNKTLNIKNDAINAFYPELSGGKKTVIKFEYKRQEIPNTADSGYSEIIYAEIDSDSHNIYLKNEALQEAKILFGRICFCRGETGYFLVKEGVFKVSLNKDGTKTYILNFKINEVPQIITMFQETQ